MVTLTGWKINTIKDLRGHFIYLSGNVYGHLLISERKRIYTTQVVSLEIDYKRKAIKAQTQNTLYTLDLSEMEPDNKNIKKDHIIGKSPSLDEKSFNIYKLYTEIIFFLNVNMQTDISVFKDEIIEKKYIEDQEIANYWLGGYVDYKINKSEFISSELTKDTDFLLCFSDSASYYFDYVATKDIDGNLFVDKNYSPHVGSFQDSVRIPEVMCGDSTYYLKYFPFSENKIKFYSFNKISSKDEGTPIKFSIHNSGRDDLKTDFFWGTYIISPGQTRIVCDTDTDVIKEPVSGSDLYPAVFIPEHDKKSDE